MDIVETAALLEQIHKGFAGMSIHMHAAINFFVLQDYAQLDFFQKKFYMLENPTY